MTKTPAKSNLSDETDPTFDTDPPADEYLEAAEAARYLHVTAKSVKRWAKDGWLPSVVTDEGHWCFRRRDIEAAATQMSARGAALPDV